MTMAYACIAPHGGELIPQLEPKSAKGKFRRTRQAMRKLADDIAAVRPNTIIIASPHNLRLSGRIAVVVSENSSGRLQGPRRKFVSLRAQCNVDFTKQLLGRAEDEGLPVVGANYGTSEGSSSDMPMDWGTLVPLWFPLKEKRVKTKVVIVTPSREIPLTQNFEFGRLIAKLTEKKKSRFVFVASADQAHTHSKSGPYGFNRAASKYDEIVCETIVDNRLRSILKFDPDLVEEAKPDSLWQMAMLAGILEEVKMTSELISYQVPTYYGMICASFHRLR